MNKDQFKALTERLGIRPADLRALAGVSLRAFYRYSDGSRRIPGPLAAYLRLYEQLSPPALAAERARAGLPN